MDSKDYYPNCFVYRLESNTTTYDAGSVTYEIKTSIEDHFIQSAIPYDGTPADLQHINILWLALMTGKRFTLSMDGHTITSIDMVYSE